MNELRVVESDTPHSEIGASSADRWMNCPGSVLAQRGMPNESTWYAKEGTAAHHLCELCLTKGYTPDRFLGEEIIVGNDTFEVDDEMVVAVQEYLDTVHSIMQKGDELIVEQQFNLEYLHEGMFGTVDACVYRPSTGQLYIIDFKYGKGNAVDAEDNSQLKYYALGAMLADGGKKVSEVTLVVVQPRAPHSLGPVRYAEVNSVDLMDWSADLKEAAALTQQPDAPRKAGPWCKFCRAAGVCPALREKAVESAQMTFAVETPAELEPETISEILKEASLVDDWVRAVRAYALGALERGHEVPGFKLVQKRAIRKWRDEDSVPDYLDVLGLEEDQLYTKKLISPAQAEKLVDKDGKKALQALWVKESSGYTIASELDKRAAVNVTMGSAFTADSNSGTE